MESCRVTRCRCPLGRSSSRASSRSAWFYQLAVRESSNRDSFEKKDAMEILATLAERKSEGRCSRSRERGSHRRKGFEPSLIALVAEQRARNSRPAKAGWESGSVANGSAQERRC